MGLSKVEKKKGLKKWMIAVICIICVIALAAGGVCAWLFIPRRGEESHEIWLSSDAFDVSDYQTVAKTPGEDFKILQLADIQLGLPSALAETKERIQEAVEATDPDLILLTGDNVEGLIGGAVLKPLCKFIDAFGIPWAPVFGNHDAQGSYDRNWQAEVYESCEHCLFQKGPNSIYGVGNYAVNLTENGQIVYSFILFDSGDWRTYPDGQGDWDYLKEDQINWYEWYVRGISEAVYGSYDPAAGKVVPSICALHIPLPEYADAMRDYVDADGVGTPPAGASNTGENRENVCCPPINSGMFERAKSLGSTRAFIAGHDHLNNSVIEYEGIDLAYGYKLTQNNYHDDTMLGYSLITLSADCSDLTYEQIPTAIAP